MSFRTHQNLLFFLISVIFLCSCGSDDEGNGFNGVIDPNSSLEGKWKSVAYDYTKTNATTRKIDSAFSFTGAILEEEFKSSGERVRTFLGFPETYTYERLDNVIEFTRGNITRTAKIHTLSNTHFAYTLEYFITENDTSKREFTSAQLIR